MAAQSQRYTISHTANVLGEEYVERSQNQVDPQRETAVLSLEGPRKFERLEYVGRRDATRFVPRTMETVTGTADDDTVVSLDANLQPVAGEEDIDDQEYPAVVAVNASTGDQLEIADIDYSANEVTLGSDPADGEEVKLYPILNEGTVQLRALNQFNQVIGHVYPWSTPVYRWHDYKQLKRGTEVNLQGRVSWGRYERVEVMLDSPRQIVWQDEDYPEGEYVSTFEQDLTIQL